MRREGACEREVEKEKKQVLVISTQRARPSSLLCEGCVCVCLCVSVCVFVCLCACVCVCV